MQVDNREFWVWIAMWLVIVVGDLRWCLSRLKEDLWFAWMEDLKGELEKSARFYRELSENLCSVQPDEGGR